MVVGDFAQGTQLAVLGGGPGGYVAAIRAAQLGLEVTLVEREYVGGVCLNWGCIPSKAFIYVADLKDRMEHAEKIGLIAKEITVDLPKLVGWKNDVVEKLRKGVLSLLSQHKIELVRGTATLTGENSFTVEGPEGHHRYEFRNAIIAVGSSAAELPGYPRDGKVIIDSTDALDPTEIPERMVVIGAGSVGLELGTFYAKMGTKVSILGRSEALLPQLDHDIGRLMTKAIKNFGIELILGAKLLDIDKSDSSATVRYSADGSEHKIEVNKVLVGIGRRPNTADIGLEKTGVEVDKRGLIPIDERMRTNVPGIYAIGDITAGHMLAHKASFQGKIAAEVIAGEPSAYEGVQIPGVIFSDPEIATVGLTEEEAKAAGINPKVGKFPFKALGKALAMNEDVGFVKIISNAESGIVIGVHIVGPHASDLISEGALAVASASHVDDLALTVHPHPTLPESIEEAAEQVENRAIHIFSGKTKK